MPPGHGLGWLFCRLATGETFLGIARDTKAEFSSLQAKLSGDRHPNKRLQELWNAHGFEGFEYSVVQTLEYDDPGDIDTEESEELRELCLAEDPNASKIRK
ncbi:MAG: GIY-YIG nuclease family protein [Gordonibacter sp.]